MENNRYIVVMGWMMTALGLSGNDLLAYALIYGYSQDNQGSYFGSLSHTAEALNVSRRAVTDILNRLVERGVITRQNMIIDGINRCAYRAIVPRVATTPPDSLPPAPRKNARPQQRFVKPTREEVQEYCRQRGGVVDAQRFYDFYEANGWVQGRGKPIRDWRAAVRTWERTYNTHNNGRNGNSKDDILARRQEEIMREVADIDAGYRARSAPLHDSGGMSQTL